MKTRIKRFGPLFGLALLSVAACGQRGSGPAENAAADHAGDPKAAAAPVIERLDPGLDAVIAPGTTIRRVATGFVFTEGPMWRDGRLWFSDVQGDTVYAVSPNGEKAVLIRKAGGYPNPPAGANLGPNGMVPDKDGSVLLVQMGGRRISRVGPDMKPKPFLAEYRGKRLNSPNDLVFAPDGALWFTDPPFGLPKMDKDPAKELPFNGVFRYANGKLTAVITDLTIPNGIGLSPDGKTLYVNNYGPDIKVMAYDLSVGGNVSNGRALATFAETDGPGGADGLKVDMAGNIWTTGPGGIRIITPKGKILGFIRMPKQTANLAFGGDGHTLYITSSDSVYSIRSRISGEIPLYASDR